MGKPTSLVLLRWRRHQPCSAHRWPPKEDKQRRRRCGHRLWRKNGPGAVSLLGLFAYLTQPWSPDSPSASDGFVATGPNPRLYSNGQVAPSGSWATPSQGDLGAGHGFRPSSSSQLADLPEQAMTFIIKPLGFFGPLAQGLVSAETGRRPPATQPVSGKANNWPGHRRSSK